MVSKLTTPERDEAVNTLLALGTDLDEQGAIALLKKHRWDVEKAASDMFNEPPLPPPREYLPPSPDPNASGNATAAWDKSKQYDGKGGSSAGALVTTTTASASSSTATLGASGSSKSGALNVPSAIVPSQPRRRETIDLTGDDEEEQMRKAMAASLEDNTPQEAKDVPVYGPRLPGEEDTQIWRPNAGMSQEDQALSRALEASLASSLNADVYEELTGEALIRPAGKPCTLRTKHLGSIQATLLFQALYCVPQMRDVIATFRAEEDLDINNPAHKELGQCNTMVDTLQKIFATLEMSQKAYVNIDAVLGMFDTGHFNPGAPGDDIKRLYDEKIALPCDTIFALQRLWPPDPITKILPRFLIAHTVYQERDAENLANLRLGENGDVATVEVMASTTAAEPNTLEAALFNYFLKSPLPAFFAYLTPVLGIKVRRHDGPSSERTPLSYPARLFLDPYLWENRALVGEKLRDIERCFEDIEKIGKVAEYFSAREDKDPTGDLKQTIHYLENVADPKGDAARAERLKEMAGKLKETLARIEEQLGQCSQRTVELRNQAAATLQVPELQRRPYDLRAVLVHDGLIGREHMYAYLRDQRSGKWFKSWDAFAEEVPEATVLNDSSGLHLNSGPYFFLYSEALPEDYDMSENHWPVPIMELLQEDNAVFRRELPLNVAEELEERDLALRSLQPPLASSTLSSATDSAAGTPPPVSSASPQVTMPDKDSMDTSR